MKVRLAKVFPLVAMGLFIGCGETTPTPDSSKSSALSSADKEAAEKEHGHSHAGHGAGPHEGTLLDWGGGAYHVEFTVDHDKKETTVYILGSDEKTPAPIKTDKIKLVIYDPLVELELIAKPLDGETDGKSSCFVGTLDALGTVKEFEGTISGEIDGTPYTGDFKEEPHGEHKH